jgi:signal transduction histidine kinase
MRIEDYLPIIIPAVLIQLAMQVYFINHCWKNPGLSRKQKAFFIPLIVLFNLFGAAIYLFSSERSINEPERLDYATPLDEGAQMSVFVLMLIAFEGLSVNIVINGIHSQHQGAVIGTLSAILLVAIVNGFIPVKKSKLLYYALPAIMILLAITVNYLEFTMNSRFIVLAVLATVINSLRLRHGRLYALITFMLYIGSEITKLLSMGVTDQNTIIGSLYVDIIIFILLFAAFYAIKRQRMLNTMLQAAFEELKEKSERLEEMGAIAERNRIAGEIHDNVGHMLTAAMVSIEAGEKLIGVNEREASQKLLLARDQVANGLQSIRMSVKAIKQGDTEGDFPGKVNVILEQIQRDTGLMINAIVEVNVRLLPIQQSVLLQSILECVTNSIKHGKSTQADLLIQEHKGVVNMTFSDNGRGSEGFTPGFGLNHMRERVESLGGALKTESAPGEGFTVSLSIPVGENGGQKV